MATYPVGLPTGGVTVSVYELIGDLLGDGDDLPDATDVTLTVEFLPTVKAIRYVGKIYRFRAYTWTGTSVLTAPDGTGNYILPSTDVPASDGSSGWYWQARLSLAAGSVTTQLTSEPFRLPAGATVDLGTGTTLDGLPLLPLEVQGWDVGALIMPGATLPDQTSAAGKVLTSDGVSASWQAPTGGSATITDATDSAKGVVQLAGDLSGTAALPLIGAGKVTTVKLADGAVTDGKVASGIAQSKVAGLVDDLASKVPNARTISTDPTSGLTGGGALSSNLSVSVAWGSGTNQVPHGDHTHSDAIALSRLPAGSMVAAYWSAAASAWQYNGVTLTARPSGLPASCGLWLIGAPAATGDPTYMTGLDVRVDA